eukprot:766657-Hanusia_phi.AAC.4
MEGPRECEDDHASQLSRLTPCARLVCPQKSTESSSSGLLLSSPPLHSRSSLPPFMYFPLFSLL